MYGFPLHIYIIRQWSVKVGEEHHAREMTRALWLFRLRRQIPAVFSFQVLRVRSHDHSYLKNKELPEMSLRISRSHLSAFDSAAHVTCTMTQALAGQITERIFADLSDRFRNNPGSLPFSRLRSTLDIFHTCIDTLPPLKHYRRYTLHPSSQRLPFSLPA